MRLPILVIHIAAGVLGIVSGAGALWFRKGSRRHGLAGNVFFGAMLVMGSSAAILGNVFGGLFACYLVTTGWLTARRRNGDASVVEWGALLFALAFGIVLFMNGVAAAKNPTRSFNGVPPGMFGMFFFLGSVALLAAAGDLRMLVRGVSGAKRIVRHLWRMCFSFFIATGSFFLGQQKVFPKAWRGSAVWLIPALFPLAALVFWWFRVRFQKSFRAAREVLHAEGV
jgi:hypothetical protein